MKLFPSQAKIFTLCREILASQATFLFFASGFGNVLSYLYLIFMGRTLGPEQYGILGALFAIFYIACLVGQSLRQSIATRVAEIKARRGESAATSVFLKLAGRIALLCLIPLVGFIAAAKPIAFFFNLTESSPVIILSLSVFTALILDTIVGFQQGLQKFRVMGITGFITSQGMKCVFGVMFVSLGCGLPGAVGALLASTTLAIALGLFFIRKELTVSHEPTENVHRLDVILLPALLLAVFIAMPTSIDVMLVTHYFPGAEAGHYTAAATIGKVVIFLPMAISFVLLPKATVHHTRGYKSRIMLLQALALTLLLSGGVALICWILPDVILCFFLGADYLAATELLGFYVLATFFFSLNSMLVHYSLAVRKLRLILFADIVTLAEVMAILEFHSSLLQVIWIMLAGNLLILVVILPLLLLKKQVIGRGLSRINLAQVSGS